MGDERECHNEDDDEDVTEGGRVGILQEHHMYEVRICKYTMETICRKVLPYCVKSSSNSYSSSAMYHAPDHLLSKVCMSL